MRIRLYHPGVLLIMYVLLNSLSLSAQPLIQRSQDPDLYTPDRFVYKPGNGFHPSVRPYLKSETDLLQSEDSLITSLSYASRWKSKVGDWVWRKIFNEDLLVVDIPDFHLAVNPLLRMEVGQDFKESNHFYTNTRGFMADGHIGKQFAFATRFYENQAQFPLYIDSEIRRTGVIPGQGLIRTLRAMVSTLVALKGISRILRQDTSTFSLVTDETSLAMDTARYFWEMPISPIHI